jgi:hypothetical protein
VVEAEGITFVADDKTRPWLDGLQIEVLNYWGRDNVVAHHPTVQACR